MKFMLILFVLNAGGDQSTFVLDLDLSRSECRSLERSWKATLDEFSEVDCERQK